MEGWKGGSALTLAARDATLRAARVCSRAGSFCGTFLVRWGRVEQKAVSAYNESSKRFLSSSLAVVDSALEPIKVLKILMEGLAPEDEAGLWLINFRGIPVARSHSPFDLAYLDADNRILQAVEITQSSRFVPFKGNPASALILRPRSLSSSGSFTGDRILFKEVIVEGADQAPAIPPQAHSGVFSRIVRATMVKTFNVPEEQTQTPPRSGSLLRSAGSLSIKPPKKRKEEVDAEEQRQRLEARVAEATADNGPVPAPSVQWVPTPPPPASEPRIEKPAPVEEPPTAATVPISSEPAAAPSAVEQVVPPQESPVPTAASAPDTIEFIEPVAAAPLETPGQPAPVQSEPTPALNPDEVPPVEQVAPSPEPDPSVEPEIHPVPVPSEEPAPALAASEPDTSIAPAAEIEPAEHSGPPPEIPEPVASHPQEDEAPTPAAEIPPHRLEPEPVVPSILTPLAARSEAPTIPPAQPIKVSEAAVPTSVSPPLAPDWTARHMAPPRTESAKPKEPPLRRASEEPEESEEPVSRDVALLISSNVAQAAELPFVVLASGQSIVYGSEFIPEPDQEDEEIEEQADEAVFLRTVERKSPSRSEISSSRKAPDAEPSDEAPEPLEPKPPAQPGPPTFGKATPPRQSPASPQETLPPSQAPYKAPRTEPLSIQEVPRPARAIPAPPASAPLREVPKRPRPARIERPVEPRLPAPPSLQEVPEPLDPPIFPHSETQPPAVEQEPWMYVPPAQPEKPETLQLAKRWDVKLLYSIFPDLHPDFRPELQTPRFDFLKEAGKTAEDDQSRKIKILNWLYPDLHLDTVKKRQREERRAPRIPLPKLVGYFFTGGKSEPNQILNISVMGFYMKTDQRWMPGTVIRVTLQMIDSDGSNPGDSITVLSRVVNWDDDGGGFEFVLPGFID